MTYKTCADCGEQIDPSAASFFTGHDGHRTHQGACQQRWLERRNLLIDLERIKSAVEDVQRLVKNIEKRLKPL